MSEVDEIVQEFLVESLENLDQLDRELVALEDDPSSRERLASIFRTIHTIKGTSGFLAYVKLEAIAHVGETLLSKLRDGELQLTKPIADALLAMVDAIRGILSNIEAGHGEGDGNYDTLIQRLAALSGGKVGPASVGPRPVTVVPSRRPTAPNAASVRPVSKLAPPPPPAPKITIPAASNVPDALAAPPAHAAGAPHDELLRPGEPEARANAEEADEKQSGKTALADASIRVDVGLLDRLMNLVGELVLARNQVLQHVSKNEDAAFSATSQRLNLITTELQEGIMKTRMQPIGNIWTKFPRIVRDLAATCGKQIRIEMDGAETELDRTIIEAIKDPLTHIVRNSADHGIEAPDERVKVGKPAVGVLELRAFHEGGKVNIEISDDGRGIDPSRVKQKAIQRGLVTAERADRMTEREILAFIFAPGFSTADKVTNVSGRGVGMDVVKTNIERIGGTVDLQTRKGFGTSLKIKIPLTLAIIPALVVTSATDRYAIPQVNLLELVRLEREQAKAAIESVHGAPVYRLRGRLLPLVYLREVLKLDEPPSEDDAVNIVVLQADDRHFGLVVDGVSDTEEIVVKPLGKELKGVGVFAGATIMGDGKVALILDVLGLAHAASLLGEGRERALADIRDNDKSESDENRQTLLLFRLREGERMAFPLKLVARLEEIPKSSVERAGGDEVVQYRNEILPLVRLAKALGRSAPEPEEMLQVIVYAGQGRSVGLVVESIEDVVEQEVQVKCRVSQPGVLGAAVVQGKVTELVDVPVVIQRALPHFFDAPVAAE